MAEQQAKVQDGTHNVTGKQYQELETQVGTKVSTGGLEDIVIGIDPELVIRQYAELTANRISYLNPERAETVGITKEMIFDYLLFLLDARVKVVNGEKVAVHQLKVLNVPSWIEFVLNQIGVVVKYEYGLRIKPKLIPKVTVKYEDALAVSTKLKAFERDGLVLVNTALSRKIDGDEDTMSFAVVDHVTRGLGPNQHPLKSYVACFLGQKLIDEMAWKVLFRVSYDSISVVMQQLLNSEAIWR